MGTYTPNYNLYMPSIGEQGWGELVSNNFEILDTNLNDLQTQITTNLNNLNNLQDQIDVIDTNIGNGTRVLSISSPSIVNSENFENYAFYDENNVYIARFYGNTTFSSISQPHSCRLMIIVVGGNATISGNIDTYPTTLQSETPPGTPETNTYSKEIHISNFSSCTITYTANGNNSQLTMNYDDYIKFLGKLYVLLIPHAIAAGGTTINSSGKGGTANNTCNGGGGVGGGNGLTGGTGCIFGQYSGGQYLGGSRYEDGYGYGSGATNKYRCGLVIIVNGNLTITNSGTITQIGGDGSYYDGGYGGGTSFGGGGGGAPVFIYYTGTYVNNGTINTAGGSGYNDSGNGGAGGIKTTKITL